MLLAAWAVEQRLMEYRFCNINNLAPTRVVGSPNASSREKEKEKEEAAVITICSVVELRFIK